MTHQDYALLALVQYIYNSQNSSTGVSYSLAAKERGPPSDLESHG